VQRSAVGEAHWRRPIHPRPTGEVARHPRVALHRPTGDALGALTAEVERHDDVIALVKRRHVATDAFHHPGALVTQQGRVRERQPTVLGGCVGVADPRGDDAHDDLVVTRVVNDEIAKLERRAR
jgi:hypothetical protein